MDKPDDTFSADRRPAETCVGAYVATGKPAGPPRRFSSVRRLVRGTSGSTTIEFAFVAAPFLVLLFGALQLFILCLSQQLLETAAETAGRQIMTGQVQKQGLSAAQFKQVVCTTIPAFLSCSSVMVDAQVATSFSGANTSAPTLTYDSNGNVSNTWNFNTGQPGSIVVMRLMYQWPMVNMLNFQLTNLSTGSRLLMATAVFKNESYQ